MLTILFYILSAVTLSMGLLTVLSKNPIQSAVYMVICFFSLAGHFLMINAQFLAVVHVIVYTGAVMVLLLFTLMLMNLSENHETRKKILGRIVATLSACLLAIVLLAVFMKAIPLIDSYKVSGTDFQSMKVLGKVLLDEYLVPFEFSSILLLTAMIGSVLISKRNKNINHAKYSGTNRSQ